MNTNSNIYTVVYTTLVCVLVAVILAFVSQSLKSTQEANEKAETVSQILTAAQFGDKGHWGDIGNGATLAFYKENASEALLVSADGKRNGTLDVADAQVADVSALKAQNYNIKDGSKASLPVYVFKDGTVVVPVYGAGLWGPVWGYVAFGEDLKTIKGAYFDHSSETPGLGGKIKDDPSFRGQFVGKEVDFDDATPFAIVKGGAPAGKRNAVDAISGATMTCNGVGNAINVWLEAYKAFLQSSKTTEEGN